MAPNLIDRIYEAAALPDLWPSVLEHMGERFQAKGGLLFANSAAGTKWLGGGPVVEVMAEFVAQGWMAHNTRPGILLARRHPGFLIELDAMPEEDTRNLPIFRDFLRPKGCFATAGTLVPGLDGDMMILSVEGFPDYPEARAAVPELDSLRPHLARAAQLSSQFRLERMRGHMEALQAIGAAACVVNGQGVIQMANERMQPEIGATLFDFRARVRLSDASADALLQQCLEMLRAGASQGRSIGMHDASGAARVLHVLPIKGRANDLFMSSVALLVLTNPHRDAPLPDGLLQDLFDLTPAECRLTSRVCGGEGTLQEIANDLGVSVNTVKAQLQAVFQKTGTTRQIELAKLVFSTSAI